ncbi:NUDIX domain-containing protein [Rhizobium sp. ZPR3]|uniref:NUDIX domain-containing protein n=2 Tax=unclassified Rhizobium TaxID=2613769 RepID=A0AAU7SHW9_9HYPH
MPKGHVEPGETSQHAAQREAFEEAGIQGLAWKPVIGRFLYRKEGRPLIYKVSVHLLTVQGAATGYPEQGERQIQWVRLADAPRVVANPALGRIIASVMRYPLYGNVLRGTRSAL